MIKNKKQLTLTNKRINEFSETIVAIRKEKSDLDIEFDDGTEDEEYLNKLYEILPEMVEEVRPDIMFYLAGADIIESDRLGRLSVSKEGCAERDNFVFRTAKKKGIPVAVVTGGGYSPMVRDVIDTHANTFRMAQKVFF